MRISEFLSWSKLRQNKSLKNVMVLTSGTVLSQVLPILFFPVLSRLYTPSDYGILGLFMSISMLLMLVSNLQLNYALLIPREDSDALKVLMTGLIIIIFFTVISFLFILAFGGFISALLGSPELKSWLYLIPATVLFSGANIQLSAWFNRTGQFKVISASRIATSIVTISCSLILSFVIAGPGGLVVSYLAGNFFSFLMLMQSFYRTHSFRFIALAEMKSILQLHRNFPLYTLPTELISNFAQQLPMFIFSMYSGVQSVGWFSRSRQMLGLPINYISGSISEVYKQKASDAFRNNPAALRPLFLKTMGYLFVFSVIPFLVIGLFSPFLFAFFFGENWRQAGVFTQCLVAMYFFKFVISPLTFNFYLFGKQRLDLILHILIIIITALALYIGFNLFDSTLYSLVLFSLGYSIIYLVYGVISYRLTLKPLLV